MTVSVRFAPSPTGFLHVGNARKAIINVLFAKKLGGTCLLRLDDTDKERCEDRYVDALKEDLAWLELSFDKTARQSDRLARYEDAVDRLKASGRLYPCYETPEELEFRRKAQRSRGLPPIYDRAALKLTEKEKAALEEQGKKPHWRFKLEETKIQWVDGVQGEVNFEPGHLSDPILLRENGIPLYTLTSVVDDVELGITHVIRGADHVANTAVQLQLCAALGVAPDRFTFAHFPLLTDSEGAKLSKRFKSLSLQDLRAQEIAPEALSAFLMALGTSQAPEISPNIEALSTHFDLNVYGKSSPKFSEEELHLFNTKWIRALDYEGAKKRLKASEKGLPPSFSIDFWHLVAPCLERLSDVHAWHDTLYTGPQKQEGFSSEDRLFFQTAHSVTPPGIWSASTWDQWVSKLKDTTDRKGKFLFKPLRLALTGQEHGPELKEVFYLLGPEEVLKRLESAAR
ncbi:MAG: glutamate--tRNA ligase [bacterium]|nr:glutamate--tRNA ligase [bacterium]